jgi:hypothetical protein
MNRVELSGGLKKVLCGLSLAVGLTCGACQQPSAAPAAAEAIDPALAGFVLSDLPSDVPNRCFLDFGGKVALVGYAIDPVGVASPGTHVKLTLYWRSTGALGPGWGLFTHLVIPREPHRLLDSAGPLRKLVPAAGGGQRQALGPSEWEPGKVYVDQLDFDIPTNARAPELTVVAGVWRDALRVIKDGETPDPKLALPGLRLPVLSGPADDMQRGIVLHIETGVPVRTVALTPALTHAPLGAPVKPRGQNEANGIH